MKYESVTKRARNELLCEYFLQHPELSLKEIGAIFGISKQRVSKIIIKREKGLAGVLHSLRNRDNYRGRRRNLPGQQAGGRDE